MLRIKDPLLAFVVVVAIVALSLAEGAEVDLVWSDNSDNEFGFKIEASADGGEFEEIGETAENVAKFTHSIPDESHNVVYTYRIKAYNYAGNSGPSNTVEAKGKHFEALDGKPSELKFDVPSLTINTNRVVINKTN